MSLSAFTSRDGRARLLAGLFLSASLIVAISAPADAAPHSKCRNNHGPNHD